MLCFLCIPCAASQQHKRMRFIAHRLPSGGIHECTEIIGNCGARTLRLDIVNEDDSIATSDIAKRRRAYSLDSFRRYAYRVMEGIHAFEISPNKNFNFVISAAQKQHTRAWEWPKSDGMQSIAPDSPSSASHNRIERLMKCMQALKSCDTCCRWHSRRSARDCVCIAWNNSAWPCK